MDTGLKVKNFSTLKMRSSKQIATSSSIAITDTAQMQCMAVILQIIQPFF
jgi:hypothetical protein